MRRVLCIWVLFGVGSMAVDMFRVPFLGVGCDGGDFFPRSFVMASWILLIINALLRSARALSLATRYILSFYLLALVVFAVEGSTGLRRSFGRRTCEGFGLAR